MRSMLFTAIFLAGVQTAGITQTIDAFEWLLGIWENMDTRPGETAREVWTMGADNELIGIGVTLQGTDTVFVEHLKILKQEDKFYYAAVVSHNPAPVLFKMTEIGSEGFTSENPEHDFPKSISYRLDGDILHAVISDGNKQIPFRFTRIR